MMTIKSLFSGSSGNCTIIENETTKIMIDAGVSFKKIETKYNNKLNDLDGLLITHSHGDHVYGAGVVGRKTKCTIYIPEKSYEERKATFEDTTTQFVEGGDELLIKDFKIKVFSTKHDVASVGYTIIDIKTNKKFGYVTDTGVFTKSMKIELENCNALFIESDYDEESLEKNAEYDDFLKERIRSPLGHMSNQTIIEYLKSIDVKSKEFIIFGHLSRNTNSPELLTNQLHESFNKDLWSKFNIAGGEEILVLTL